MIKRFLLLSFFLLSGIGMILTHAQETIPTVLPLVVDHINDYLLNPIDLNDKGVEWDWQIVAGGDFAEGCRERDASSQPITDVFYDIQIDRLNEHYHYRVSMDEQIIIPCIALATAPDNVLPHMVDALADLNRRLHMEFTPNDIPWTWAERQFEDYMLGCATKELETSKYDRRTNGYVISFKVQGETWNYRVSGDRFVVKLSTPECD